MARHSFVRAPVAASFVLGSLALLGQGLTQGCTQDFGTFDGSGGSDPSGPGSTGTSTGTGTPTSSSSGSGNPTSTSSAGGGEGGGPSSTSGGGQGGTGGGPASCETPEECDDGEACTTDTCDAGTCNNAALSDGTTEPGYVDDPADCVVRVCQAGEGTEVADDDDDPPEDDVACRERVCDGTNVADGDPIREGLACGDSPLVCEDGTCVGCDDAADCPTPPGACEVAICDDDGVCGAEVTDVDPADGDLEDCRTPTCDGTDPNIVFEEDDTQTPADTECGTGVCNGMTPDLDPVGEGNDCNISSGVCDGDQDDAACVECVDDQAGNTTDSGCANPTSICDDSGTPTCVRCLPEGGPPNVGCNGGAPVCDPDLNAGDGGCVDCYNDGGQAVGCTNPANDQCEEAPGAGTCFDVCYDDGTTDADPGCTTAGQPQCDEANQDCQECTVAADCATNPNGTLCNQTGNTECGCSAGENSPQCTASPLGDDCISGACGCNMNDDCGAPATCQSGTCQ